MGAKIKRNCLNFWCINQLITLSSTKYGRTLWNRLLAGRPLNIYKIRLLLRVLAENNLSFRYWFWKEINSSTVETRNLYKIRDVLKKCYADDT
jgi:hypothetical protein